MTRDYETPEDYMGPDHEAEDAHADRMGDADREEAAIRRWEERREMPYEDDEQDEVAA